MRLTLRTLLAWLDDTLPPAEVREIGHMVNGTPFAKELVERIHKVTRQRRLTVPNSGGPDGADPNLVAAYLDNQLTPEQVAEFEKKCLTSDVHLAEVASVHQVLSLIGQKAKVPAEARTRMYHLVRGREAVSSKAPRAFAPAPQEPAAAPVPPWVPEELPRKSVLERFGPLAAVAALVAVLIWTATTLLKPGARDEADSSYAVLQPGAKGEAAEPAKKEGAPEAAKTQPTAPGAEAANKAAPAAVAPDEAAPEAAVKEGEPAPAEEEAEKGKAAEPVAPAGAVGVVAKVDGLLLRHNPTDPRSKWERLADQMPLRAGDRIAGLEPFRSTIQLGQVQIELVKEAEVRLDKPGNAAARFELVRGRVALHAPGTAGAVVVDFGGSAVAIDAASDTVVGLSRVDHRAPGEAEAMSAPSLRIDVPDGEVTLEAGGSTAKLAGPGWIEFQPPKHLTEPKSGVPARWIAEPGPSPVDQQLGKQFASYFKGNKPLMTGLIEAQLDDQREIRQLAIEGLGVVGSLSQVIAALTTPVDAVSRRAAIRVLREFLARGPGAVKDVRAAAEEFGGKEWSEKAEKLLVGFTPAEARQEKTYEALIADLRHTDIGIRELSLDNLQALTGRDALGYDPGNPEGAGLEAWKDLLRRKELPPKGQAEEK